MYIAPPFPVAILLVQHQLCIFIAITQPGTNCIHPLAPGLTQIYGATVSNYTLHFLGNGLFIRWFFHSISSPSLVDKAWRPVAGRREKMDVQRDRDLTRQRFLTSFALELPLLSWYSTVFLQSHHPIVKISGCLQCR